MPEATQLQHTGDISRLILNRPDQRNALNDQMMDEMIEAVAEVESRDSRVLLITGAGSAFCAGADLNWMAAMKDAGYSENRQDAGRLARLFRAVRTAKPVTMAVVNGPAIGGAVGLVAACDIAVAVETAVFSFGEVRLGIVPAVIGPYIVEKTGASAARYFMLTGERFDGKRAREIGLVHRLAADRTELAVLADDIVAELQAGGKNAQHQIKALSDRISPPPDPELESYTVDLIAHARVSAEGQEGIRAFLEKRKPQWTELNNEDI